jgi:hypothetical protein
LTQLQGLAREANIGEPTILSFHIGLGATPPSALAKKVLGGAVAKLPSPDAYHVVIDARQSGRIPIPQITAVVAKEFDSKLVSYRKLVSR